MNPSTFSVQDAASHDSGLETPLKTIWTHAPVPFVRILRSATVLRVVTVVMIQ